MKRFLKIMAVFGVLGIAALSFVVWEGSSNVSEMEFHLVPSGLTPAWIAAEGVIKEDTPARFSEFLSKKCKEQGICDLHKAGITTVGFHSKGGDVLAGMELGRIIRDMRLNTALARVVSKDDSAYHDDPWTEGWGGGQCESACAYAFFGGVSRQLTLFNADRVMNGPSKRGSLGVHQYYEGRGFASDEIGPKLESKAEQLKLKDETAKTQYYSALIVDHLGSMGIKSDILLKASQTHKGEMLYLEKNELLTANAITLDILVWRRSGSSSMALGGVQSPHDVVSDVYATVDCIKNEDESYSVFMALSFKPGVVESPDDLTDSESSPRLGKDEQTEYNGFTLSYGGRVAVAENLSTRFYDDGHGGEAAEMRFDAKLEKWEDIYDYANGVLTLEPVGRLARQRLRPRQVNVFLNDIFWGAFSDLANGKLHCSSRYGGVSAARAIGSDYQKKQAAPSPSQKEAPVVQKTAKLEFLEQVFFEESVSILSRTAQIKLSTLARKIVRASDAHILLQGRTANKEGEFVTREATLRLGADRNTAVASYLMRQGVNPSQIAVVSYGRERPIADKAGEAQNRTVTIVLR